MKNSPKVRLGPLELVIILILTCVVSALIMVIFPDSPSSDDYMDVTPQEVYNPGTWIN